MNFFRRRAWALRLLSPFKRLFLALSARASDPDPDLPPVRQQRILVGAPTLEQRCNDAAASSSAQQRCKVVLIAPAAIDWIWFPLLVLLGSAGLLVIAYVYSHSRNEGTTRLRNLFYPGLLLIFTPTAIRLIGASASRAERIALLCVAGMFCYLIKPLTSPLHFYLYDEFLHWRTEIDVTTSGHLFTPNTLLPVSPYYPGLELMTNAFSTLSGLDIFHSSLILVGVARLLMTLTLYAMNEELFRSPRVASIATLLYMVNPHYIFFDTQYAYESLALPLALVVLCIMAPHQAMTARVASLKGYARSTLHFIKFSPVHVREEYRALKWERRVLTLLAFVVLSGLVFTHHATAFFFMALLILWAVLFAWLRLVPIYRSHLLWLAVAGTVLSILWINAPNNPVVGYLGGFLSSVFTHTGKHFTPIAVHSYSALPWEKNLAQYGSYFTMACLPFGLLCLWKRYKSHALAWMLGLVSLGLPASQVLRTSDNGIQLADRASVVLYIGVSAVLALFVVQFWPARKMTLIHSLLIGSVVTALFMGGYILSGGSGYGSPPTPYVVGADSRSIDEISIEAAIWTYSYLGPHNRVGTDRTNQLLMATFGDQRIVDSIADHVDIAPIYFASTLDPTNVALMKQAQISYLIVDERLSQSPPVVGSYYEKSEPGAFQHFKPVSLQALLKFDTIPKISKIYDDGNIVIFDVREISHAYQKT